MNAKIATIALLAVVGLTAALAIYFDSIATVSSIPFGGHGVSYAIFPEMAMIGAVSLWATYLFDCNGYGMTYMWWVVAN